MGKEHELRNLMGDLIKEAAEGWDSSREEEAIMEHVEGIQNELEAYKYMIGQLREYLDSGGTIKATSPGNTLTYMGDGKWDGGLTISGAGACIVI